MRTVYLATPGLSAATRPTVRTKQIVAGLAGELRAGRATLVQMINSWLRRPVVLTVDQFEELFTLCRDEGSRAVFVDNLLGLIERPHPPHRLILTMRSDFEAKVALLADLKPRFDAARVQVTALSITQLREAIEGPAQRVGLAFEEGIIDDLIGQALGESAALPLLQFTLSRLWELRTRNRVRLETYRVLGGMGRALSTSADAWYQQLIPEEQRTARHILLDLVRPADPVIVAAEAIYKGERRRIDQVLSEGLEVTRGRVRVAEIYRSGEDPERIMRVLGSMIKQRLVRLSPGDTPADDQVEVSHEALIRNWEALQGWIEQDLERLRQRGRLIEAASQWEQSQQNPDLFWRGIQLEEARRSGIPDLSVAAFLWASQEAEERAKQQQRTAREQLTEAKRREAEAKRCEAEEREQAAEARAFAAETARGRAEEQARNVRRLRSLSVVLALLMVVAVVTTIFAFNWAGEAQNEASNAQLARAAAEVLRSSAETGRQIAEVAQANAQTAATAVQQSALTAVAGQTMAIAAANQRASAEAHAVVLVTSVSNERATAQILVTQVSNERSTAQSAANERASAEAQAEVLVTSVSNEHATAQSALTSVAALNATLQAKNKQQAEENNNLQVQGFLGKASHVTESNGVGPRDILDLLTEGLDVADLFPEDEAIKDGLQDIIQRGEDLLLRVIMSSSNEPSVAWSPDANQIVITDGSSANVWDESMRKQLAQLSGHTALVQSVAWSRDGTRIATASNDRTIIVWSGSGSSWKATLTLTGHKQGVRDLAWSPDGTPIVSDDGVDVIIWDSTSGTVLSRSLATGERLTQAVWSPDGSTFVTAGNGLKLRDGLIGAELRSGGKGTSFTSVAWSPDGQGILTVSAAGDIQIWNTADLSLRQRLARDNFKGTAAMWSPSSSRRPWAVRSPACTSTSPSGTATCVCRPWVSLITTMRRVTVAPRCAAGGAARATAPP